MDILAVLALITKGITIAQALLAAGQSAVPAFDALKNLISGAQSGSVTQAQLDQTEALLDQMVDDFNLDLPPLPATPPANPPG